MSTQNSYVQTLIKVLADQTKHPRERQEALRLLRAIRAGREAEKAGRQRQVRYETERALQPRESRQQGPITEPSAPRPGEPDDPMSRSIRALEEQRGGRWDSYWDRVWPHEATGRALQSQPAWGIPRIRVIRNPDEWDR